MGPFYVLHYIASLAQGLEHHFGVHFNTVKKSIKKSFYISYQICLEFKSNIRDLSGFISVNFNWLCTVLQTFVTDCTESSVKGTTLLGH